MPTGTKITSAQRSEIMDLHSNGMIGSAIAETLSLGASTVCRVIAQNRQKTLETLTERKRHTIYVFCL